MNNRKVNILLVDDDPLDRRLVEVTLARSNRSEQYNVETAGTLSEAAKRLSNGNYDVLLLDLNLPDSSGIDTVQKAQDMNSDASVIVLTGLDDEEMGLEAIRRGAEDYLIKGESLEHILVRTIRYSLERKRVRQRLIETENRFRSVVQTAGSAIFVLSPEYRILEWNEQAEHLYGWRRQEVLNKDYLGLFVPDDTRDQVAADMRKVLSGKTANSFENLIRVRDGSQRILLWNASPLFDAKGQPIGVIAVGQDITDRKRMEDELREHRGHLQLMVSERTANLEKVNEQLRKEIDDRMRAEQELLMAKREAEAANQTKSEFLANMSHELRTPLHSILSFASFGIKKYAGARPRKLLDYFSRIKQSGQTLLELLNNLLDLTKLESKKAMFAFEPADLGILVRSVTSELDTLLSEQKLTVRYEVSEFDERITLDADKIKQVLRNLLNNAIKFSPEGGIIDVAVCQVENSARVSVRDQGPGIPQDELVAVFDKFVQSSKTKTGAGGTGLGLAICHEIIAAHEGRIWAENRQESGAVFSFEIPLSVDRDAENQTLLAGAGNGLAESSGDLIGAHSAV
ncbi:MAG: PAS domain S-box protein [Phycisphaerae bacterium]|nr:PAS domain S-box protein [Phycisphaerae bacterium]